MDRFFYRNEEEEIFYKTLKIGDIVEVVVKKKGIKVGSQGKTLGWIDILDIILIQFQDGKKFAFSALDIKRADEQNNSC